MTFKNEASKKFDVEYDKHEGFPDTPVDKIVNVTMFNSKIDGQDANCEEVLEKVVFEYSNEMIDVRPYMWEHPFTVSVHDTVDKCL